jgi:hypothetical protein
VFGKGEIKGIGHKNIFLKRENSVQEIYRDTSPDSRQADVFFAGNPKTGTDVTIFEIFFPKNFCENFCVFCSNYEGTASFSKN